MLRRTAFLISTSSSSAAAAAAASSNNRGSRGRSSQQERQGRQHHHYYSSAPTTTPLSSTAGGSSFSQPYSWLLMSVVERGCLPDGVRLLVAHPDAPPPSEILSELVGYCEPSPAAVAVILQSVLEYQPKQQYRQHAQVQLQMQQHQKDAAEKKSAADEESDAATSVSAPAAVAVPTAASDGRQRAHQRNLQLLKLWEQIQSYTATGSSGKIYARDNNLLERFCAYFLYCGLSPQVSAAVRQLPTHRIDRTMWDALMRATASGRLRDHDMLWRLVQMPSFYLQALMQCTSNTFDFLQIVTAAPFANPMLLLAASTATSNNSDAASEKSSARAEEKSASSSRSGSTTTATDFYFAPTWTVSSELCAHILSAGGGGGQIPLLCATHLMLRYLETEGKSSGRIHPVPVLAYLTCVTQQRAGGRHPIHWLVPWRLFQRLNKSNPEWHIAYPAEAGTIAKHIVEILASAAPPSMAFAAARIASARGAVDGVDIALHLLTRFNISRHQQQQSSSPSGQQTTSTAVITPEVGKIVSRVFHWLVEVVAIHKRPARHAAVILLARVLIRFGMTAELSELYSRVLDQASDMQTETRESLLVVMRDLVCPTCCSILSHFNVHEERVCDNCLDTVPAKPVGQRSSFELTQDYLERVRQKRRERRQASKKLLRDSVMKIRQERLAAGSASANEQQQQQQQRQYQQQIATNNARLSASSAPFADPAERLKMFVTSPLVNNVPARTTQGDTFIALLPESLDAQDVMATSRRTSMASSMIAHAAYGPQLVVPTGIKGGGVSYQQQQLQRQQQQQPEILDATTAVAPGAAASSALPVVASATPWVCLWCHELNPPPAAGGAAARACNTCGADTGPAAPWRFPISSSTSPSSASQQHEQQHHGTNNNNNNNNNKFNPKHEIKNKINRAISSRAMDDIVSAAYYIMLYRRSFLLRAEAARGDFVLVQALVELLCDVQERTLAAYVFSNVLPAALRTASLALVEQLASLFTTQGATSFSDIKNEMMTAASVTATKRAGARAAESSATERESSSMTEQRFMQLVFGPNTCTHCFGVHPSNECSIVTRKFSSSSSSDSAADAQLQQQKRRRVVGQVHPRSSANVKQASGLRTSPEEKLRISIADITQLVDSLTPNSSGEQAVVAAYHRFVLSPNRELFSASHHDHANRLAVHLCRVGFPKRAAFVLCHVPLEFRTNDALTQLAGWFDLSPDDIETLLKDRVLGDATNSRHPNVIQLTRYCCICFDGQHASHNCPRMREWFADSLGKDPATFPSSAPPAAAATAAAAAAPNNNNNNTTTGANLTAKRLSPVASSAHRMVQVNGWTTSGPERLHALYRFLLTNIEEIAAPSSSSSPLGASGASSAVAPELVHALNCCITRLVSSNQQAAAWRLFARCPPALLQRETIGKVLVLNGVEELLVEEMLKAPTIGPDVLQLALPPTACLICFDRGHSFQLCPELQVKKRSAAEAILHVLAHVARVRSDPARGIAAAAGYVQHMYVTGQLVSETIHRNATLAVQLAGLAQRCFHFKQNVRGYQLLRKLPFPVVTPQLVVAFWRGSGVSNSAIESELQPKLDVLLESAKRAVRERDDIAKRLFGETTTTTTTTSSDHGQNNQQQQQQRGDNKPRHQQQDLATQFDSARRHVADISKNYHQFVESAVCRHCFTAGHSILKCDLFFEESSFGRDLLSIFRVLISHSDFKPDETQRILLHLTQYLLHYHRHLPFHVIGVSRAMNSVGALLAMMHLPGIALRLLLSIPASYRARHVYHHILQAFDVSPQEKDRRSHEFLSQVHDAADIITMPDSLVQVWPPAQDIAMSHVFNGVAGVAAALAEADKQLAEDHNEIVSPKTGKVVLQSCYNPRQPPQAVDISELREAIDPTQRYIEDRIGQQIGSRHVIFSRLVELFEETDEKQQQQQQSNSASSSKPQK